MSSRIRYRRRLGKSTCEKWSGWVMPECVDGDGARSKGDGAAGTCPANAEFGRPTGAGAQQCLQVVRIAGPRIPEPTCQAKGKSSCAAGGPRVERE